MQELVRCSEERTNTVMAFEFVHRSLVYGELAITKKSKASLNSDLALSGFSYGDGGQSHGHAGAGAAAVASLCVVEAEAVMSEAIAAASQLLGQDLDQLGRVQGNGTGST